LGGCKEAAENSHFQASLRSARMVAAKPWMRSAPVQPDILLKHQK
jgi:hypothetical protein